MHPWLPPSDADLRVRVPRLRQGVRGGPRPPRGRGRGSLSAVLHPRGGTGHVPPRPAIGRLRCRRLKRRRLRPGWLKRVTSRRSGERGPVLSLSKGGRFLPSPHMAARRGGASRRRRRSRPRPVEREGGRVHSTHRAAPPSPRHRLHPRAGGRPAGQAGHPHRRRPQDRLRSRERAAGQDPARHRLAGGRTRAAPGRDLPGGDPGFLPVRRRAPRGRGGGRGQGHPGRGPGPAGPLPEDRPAQARRPAHHPDPLPALRAQARRAPAGAQERHALLRRHQPLRPGAVREPARPDRRRRPAGALGADRHPPGHRRDLRLPAADLPGARAARGRHRGGRHEPGAVRQPDRARRAGGLVRAGHRRGRVPAPLRLRAAGQRHPHRAAPRGVRHPDADRRRAPSHPPHPARPCTAPSPTGSRS